MIEIWIQFYLAKLSALVAKNDHSQNDRLYTGHKASQASDMNKWLKEHKTKKTELSRLRKVINASWKHQHSKRAQGHAVRCSNLEWFEEGRYVCTVRM